MECVVNNTNGMELSVQSCAVKDSKGVMEMQAWQAGRSGLRCVGLTFPSLLLPLSCFDLLRVSVTDATNRHEPLVA